MIPLPGIAIDPVGRNEQPRHGSFGTNVARGAEGADAVVTKKGVGGEAGGRYYRYRSRKRVGRIIPCPPFLGYQKVITYLDEGA